VRAKTGWIVGASALSGYLLAGETPLVFSILINYTKDKTLRTNNARFKKMQEDYLHEILRKWTIH
jgi:D-alanyl-D-alanine carboxypeptidase